VSRLQKNLGEWFSVAEKVVRQVQEAFNSNMHSFRQMLSLFDVDARPIGLGKSPTYIEFGRKVLLEETNHSITANFYVLEETHSDITLFTIVMKGHDRLFHKGLKKIAINRNFYSQQNEDWLKNSNVI
jgi:hypothetical protein